MTSPQRILIGALAALVLTCAVPSARAGDAQDFSKTLDKTIAVSANTSVSIENMAGEVHVTRGGPQLDVHATVVSAGADAAAARALADTIRLDVTRDGDRVMVHVHYPVKAHDTYRYIPTHGAQRREHGFSFLGMHFGSGSSSFDYQGHRVRVYRGKDKGVPLHVDLAVTVPAGLHASIDNRVGRMHANDVQGDLSLKTASGDIDAHAVTGTLDMHSGSGDMAVDNLKGTLRVRTGSGDVKLQGIQGGVDVATGSGDIHGGDIHGDRLQIRTGSGDIKLDDLAGDMKVETGSGDIGLRDIKSVTEARIGSGSGDVELGGDLSAMNHFEISSGSGDVTLVSSTPPAVHLQIRGSGIGVHWPGLRNVDSGRRHFSADVGAATGEGRISSGSGDISLR